MRTTLYNLYYIIIDTINNTIRLIYPPTPISCQITTQPFRFPDSIIPVSVNVFQ